jgi:branched-chain amino acid transport system substrate-binding protein
VALQVWAIAVEDVESFDKTPVAERIRGGEFDDTIMGDIAFKETGQMISSHYVFKVEGTEIVVLDQ